MKVATTEETSKVYTTSIKTCTCPHKQQDQMYGAFKRVHNRGGATGKNPFNRCTVCGSEKAV